MTNKGKQLSSPFSTGGGGSHFEAHVQAAFAALMITGGFSPCLPCWPITKIKLQGKYAGYETDDLIVFAEGLIPGQQRKMLGQIKHAINVTENDKGFEEVIQSAWNDFNNANVFIKNADVIALITGPMSSTDANDTRTIFEWARHSEDATDFFNKVNLANFSSERKRRKLMAFRSNLDKANGGVLVSDELVFDFLRHFHFLSFDLDIKAGITLSLLHSLIGQYSTDRVLPLWDRIVAEVQSANKNAGTLVREKLPEEILTFFTRRVVAVIPPELTPAPESVGRDWTQLPSANDLAIAILLGAWRENSERDVATVEQLAKKSYAEWILALREILHMPNSPLSLKDGAWRVSERKELLRSLGSRIFDDDLDKFRKCAAAVLTERDPQFELTPDKRYAASIYGKELAHSLVLRQGIAEGLALLGNFSDALTNCSTNKRESTALLSIRDVFSGADWVLWGSLNSLLPVLAEAAPAEFLEAVECALHPKPGPFEQLFAEEGKGAFGGTNYLTGLLWGLEALAWDTKYLVRVGVILADMAVRDPGGNLANRPANSLATILLPWFPQTTAPIEKRQALVQTLHKESPAVAWKLLLALLPNAHQSSMGAHKPSWRNTIPAEWKEGASTKDYWEQIFFYACLAVSLAQDDLSRLTELSRHLERLPKESFEKFIEHVSSATVLNRSEDERIPLWDALVMFAAKHRKFSDATWALPADAVQRVEAAAEQLAPKSAASLYRRLFDGRDYDHYNERENWEQQQKKLNERRINAVGEIYAHGGLSAILNLAESVESSASVGQAFASIAQSDADAVLLPSVLAEQNKKLSNFAAGYVWNRRRIHNWQWLDTLDRYNWSNTQLGEFLSCLPFTQETWKYAAAWLGTAEREYWTRAAAVAFQAEGDLGYAIDKLIEFGRPNSAINCLWTMLHQKRPLDIARSVKALMAAVASASAAESLDQHMCSELIKALQDDSATDRNDLFRIEWAYLPLLTHLHGGAPKVLGDRLASDADFFCEVLRLLYRSTKEEKSESAPSKEQTSIATNAWRLLDEWRTPPGVQPDGSFSREQFSAWIDKVKHHSMDSGHLNVALLHIGNVLIYSAPDPQGLWIDQTVAAALNDKEADRMRSGFRSQIIKSRGAHWVDPAAQPELQLAEAYKQKADVTENAGYFRLAITLREIAEHYEHEAQRILAEKIHMKIT